MKTEQKKEHPLIAFIKQNRVRWEALSPVEKQFLSGYVRPKPVKR